MLATHPHHDCHYAYLGFAFTCQPPWHFFGWFSEAEAIAMQNVARATGTLLRVGERMYQPREAPREVEVWVHEHVTDLAHFWDTYYAQHSELRWRG